MHKTIYIIIVFAAYVPRLSIQYNIFMFDARSVRIEHL